MKTSKEKKEILTDLFFFFSDSFFYVNAPLQFPIILRIVVKWRDRGLLYGISFYQNPLRCNWFELNSFIIKVKSGVDYVTSSLRHNCSITENSLLTFHVL